ncbi:MAG TPA: hypothetical protein DHW02_03800, partial [Ktedonobacter sp.]|nr:hypothetical protein [Ktedonobacter sp.]
MLTRLLQLNYMAFQKINAPAGGHPVLDAIMIFCANSLIFFFPIIMLMLWGIPLAWRKHSLSPKEVDNYRERRAVVLWIGVACVLAYGLNLLIEQFVFEPRPFVSHKVHLLVSHPADGSFPSDHSAWAFAVVGMILLDLLLVFIARQREHYGQPFWQKAEKKFFLTTGLLCVLALLLACSIGVARVFVGIHYPGDIIGGAIDGLFAASIVTWVRQRLDWITQAFLRLATMLR